MFCAKYRHDLGQYVLGVLDDAREEKLHRHLAGCFACQAEHQRLQRAAKVLRAGVSHPAPAFLTGQVMQNLGRTKAAPLRRSFVAPVWLATAAGLLLVVAGAWFAVRPSSLPPLSTAEVMQDYAEDISALGFVNTESLKVSAATEAGLYPVNSLPQEISQLLL